MNLETLINGRAGSIATNGTRVQYSSAESIEGEFSSVETQRGTYSVVLNGRSYTVIALPDNQVAVNGAVFPAEVFDPRSLRGRRGSEANGGKKSIVAMMPGRVVRVLVETGQHVDAGQGVIVVEAMKMQNEMKAAGAGVVKQIKVHAGLAVAAGDVLLVIE